MHGTPTPKSIALRERLIFALDVTSAEEAHALVERLGDFVTFFKLGLEVFLAGGGFRISFLACRAWKEGVCRSQILRRAEHGQFGCPCAPQAAGELRHGSR